MNVEVKDQSVQVSVPRPGCESFEKLMCEGMAGDLSFSNNETEGGSASEK